MTSHTLYLSQLCAQKAYGNPPLIAHLPKDTLLHNLALLIYLTIKASRHKSYQEKEKEKEKRNSYNQESNKQTYLIFIYKHIKYTNIQTYLIFKTTRTSII